MFKFLKSMFGKKQVEFILQPRDGYFVLYEVETKSKKIIRQVTSKAPNMKAGPSVTYRGIDGEKIELTPIAIDGKAVTFE